MKLVDVAEFYSARGGGVRTYIDGKLAAAAREGVDLAVVAPGPENREEKRLSGRIIWVKSPRIAVDHRYHHFDDETTLHRILDREDPDVVEASSPWRGARIVASWQGRAKKSLVMHQDPVGTYPHTFFGPLLGYDRVDRLFGFFWRHLDRLADDFDCVVTGSHFLAERLANFLRRSPQCVMFGIEKAAFSPTLRSPSVRRHMLGACGIEDENALLLVGVGRHNPEKRLGLLMNAVDRVAGTRPVGLYLIGDGLLRWLVELRAWRSRHVHLAGFVDDRQRLATLLASADVMIHGSACETFGMSVAEAICSGLPVVVPDRGGAADFADASYAETYRAGDARSCSEAILRIATRDRNALGAASAAAAESRIRDTADHFRALVAFYRSISEHPSEGTVPAPATAHNNVRAVSDLTESGTAPDSFRLTRFLSENRFPLFGKRSSTPAAR